MNAIVSTALPLPECLEASRRDGRERRHRFGALDLGSTAVEQFNHVLEQVGHAPASLSSDQIVTAARCLRSSAGAAGSPLCIRQRMWRVKAAATMMGDRKWGLDGPVAATVELVARYAAANDDLIPDREPVIGRLDDALVVDAGWWLIADEMTAYLDFRRLRRLVVGPSGERSGFDRDAWKQARADEGRLVAHRRFVRTTTYCPQPIRLFAVR